MVSYEVTKTDSFTGHGRLFMLQVMHDGVGVAVIPFTDAEYDPRTSVLSLYNGDAPEPATIPEGATRLPMPDWQMLEQQFRLERGD